MVAMYPCNLPFCSYKYPISIVSVSLSILSTYLIPYAIFKDFVLIPFH